MIHTKVLVNNKEGKYFKKSNEMTGVDVEESINCLVYFFETNTNVITLESIWNRHGLQKRINNRGS